MKVLFIHRSVGQNFLDQAHVRDLMPGVTFHDLNANTNVFTNERCETSESAIVVQDGNTNPDGLTTFFQMAETDSELKEVLEMYDWIAFKSCYSANAMLTDQSLEAAKAAYEGLIKRFIISHPNTRFLIVSPPPRRPLLSNKDAARRAQAFTSFLGNFTEGLPNAMYFDLFSLLSDSEGFLKEEYRRWLPIDQHPNRVGSEKAGRAFAGNFASKIKI